MKKIQKRLQNELIKHAYYVVTLSEMIDNKNRKDIVNSIQKNTNSLYREVMKV